MNPPCRYAPLILVCALLLGCGSHESPPTLVVHVHDGVYDFIDHTGVIVETAGTLDELQATALRPEIQELIHDHHIVVRFVGEQSANGLTVPDDVNVALAQLVIAGATSQEFDYLDP